MLDRASEITLGCLPGPTSALAASKQAAALWTPPPLYGYKINFDGEIFEQENKVDLGVVIRNHDGMVMASLFEIIPLPSIVIEVETLAARRVVEFALELGFDNIFLEGDSEVLIKLLNSSSRSLAPFGHIRNDIFFFLFCASHVLMLHMSNDNVIRLLIRLLEEQSFHPLCPFGWKMFHHTF